MTVRPLTASDLKHVRYNRYGERDWEDVLPGEVIDLVEAAKALHGPNIAPP